jgi:RNA polymerase sigma factor (TIGR02999 family)
MAASPADDFGSMAMRVETGDPAATRALFASLYSELHRLAQSHLVRSGGRLTLSPTTLLHEAYLHLSGREQVSFPDQRRFLKYASRAMRGLIIDYIRSRRAQKRGGEITLIAFEDSVGEPSTDTQAIEKLGHALDELSSIDESLAELVDLKFFCGFSFGEIASMRGVSERTVQREWAKARLLLHETLVVPESGGPDKAT